MMHIEGVEDEVEFSKQLKRLLVLPQYSIVLEYAILYAELFHISPSTLLNLYNPKAPKRALLLSDKGYLGLSEKEQKYLEKHTQIAIDNYMKEKIHVRTKRNDYTSYKISGSK